MLPSVKSSPATGSRRGHVVFLLVALAFVAMAGSADEAGPLEPSPLPQRLSETGWRDGPVAFTPQYPLWSDGAAKRRWMSLPPGTAVDASAVDAWEFPPGAKFWKEFAVEGKPVETRYIERLQDGSWRYATYAWNADGSDATLVAERGDVATLANGGRYVLPSRDDCRACHEGNAVPVIGFSAMQLSGDRDPNAVHAEASGTDLRALAARGMLRNVPQELLDTPPRIAATSPRERAALGYLHGNCAHCHNPSEAGVPVGLDLQQRVGEGANGKASRTQELIADSRFRIADVPGAKRWIEPGKPTQSVLALRMHARDPHRRMPPLGTQQVDALGVDLIDAWITALPPAKEQSHE